MDHSLPLLQTRRLGRTVRSFDRIPSTNSEALRWAKEGAPDGALVYADFQTQGRGRFGRSWQAQAGLNLTFSVVLRPDFPPDRWTLITVAACVAVCEAIDRRVMPLRSAVKWPNDILLNGMKCCGMLLETQGLPAAHSAVVLGIGLNANQIEFPAELAEKATSLRLESGRLQDRPALLIDILKQIEEQLETTRSRPSEIRRLYLSRMHDLNRSVRLRFAGKTDAVEGIAAGLDEAGGLILHTDSGMEIFHAGEVTRST